MINFVEMFLYLFLQITHYSDWLAIIALKTPQL